ncbi:hypothetical protein MHYP_G00358280 [Metynnis hypsauchen]
MVSIAVGPDGPCEPPAAKAAAPWLEESSSKLMKKSLPPLTQTPKAQQGSVKKTKTRKKIRVKKELQDNKKGDVSQVEEGKAEKVNGE